MTYAGRLDPMAAGVLVILTGEKNKERETYTGLDKDYEFEFALGIETDTYDTLGKVTAAAGGPAAADLDSVRDALKKYQGTIIQRYPPFSSKVIDGTPMFILARKGLLKDSEIPSHEVVASKLELVGSRTVSREEFKKSIFDPINAVIGDFRQKEILSHWEAYFATAPEEFTLYKARVSCGSGFYVRELVHDIGQDLKTRAVTTSILRTRVGEYHIKDSVR
jgi:tRNA pseudouridine55 synthase